MVSLLRSIATPLLDRPRPGGRRTSADRSSALSVVSRDRSRSRRQAVQHFVAHAATGALAEVANRSSVASRHSVASAFSYRSAFSVLSAASITSVASAGSVGSAGSVLSIGSAGSILSIASSGSILSFGSSGSILGAFTSGHVPSRRAGADETAATDATVARLSGLLAVAAMFAAVRPRAA